jgi:hypothetical protein
MNATPYAPTKKTFRLSRIAKTSTLPTQILPTGFQLNWDPVRNCLVDYMGIPLKPEDAQYLLERSQQHLQHSPAEIEISRQSVMDQIWPERHRHA